MSKGQNELLQAALRNRKRLAEEQSQKAQMARERKEHFFPEAAEVADVDADFAIEEDHELEVGPIAGPITSTSKSKRSYDYVEDGSRTPQSMNEAKDVDDSSAVASPLVDAPRNYGREVERYSGNLMKHPFCDLLREHFEKVQVGEGCVVVYGGKGNVAAMNTDEVNSFIMRMVIKQPDFDADVFRGNREGRFRIVAKNKK